MMRLVIAGVAAFLLSLGGTTGVLVMKVKHAAAGVDATAAASAPDPMPHPAVTKAASGGHAATPLPEAAPADTTPTAAAPALPVPPRAPGPVAGLAPAGSSPFAAARAALAADSARKDAYRQLARIFANMKTADAAKVMAYMSDDEVQGVIEQLGVRQAAGMLAALPKERAATLSRRLLHTSAEGSR